MLTHNVTQGSDEWIELRGKFQTASEAPVIMAASSKFKRDELLAIKGGYAEKEYSEWVQRNLFDKGHHTEAMARPIVEEMIGEELYPVTGSNGSYLASFDGMTMLEEIGFEHKMWNPELAERVRADDLPAEYYWQLEHQLLVCESMEKVIFVVSDGTTDNFVSMEYTRVPGRAEKLLRGWEQFKQDLANYQHEVIPAKPEAETIEAFPSLSIQLVGEVKASNLPAYRNRALAFIESINTDLQTDQDFANAEEAVKFCEKVEKEIDLVKQQALSQTNTIDELFRAMDAIRESLRQKRLTLDKLVKNRKEQIRSDIVEKARQALLNDISAANDEFRPQVVVTGVTADFAGAVKGKRTIESLRSAANDELTRARLQLGEKRDHIRGALKIIHGTGEKYRSLFNDVQQLVEKQHDHITLIVKQRVDAHEAAQRAAIEAEAQKRALEIAEEAQKKAVAAKQQADDLLATEQTQTQRKADSAPVTAAITQSSPATTAPTEKPRVVSTNTGALRPTDDEIIELIATHYRVNEFKAIEWIQSMNLDAATRRVVGAR